MIMNHDRYRDFVQARHQAYDRRVARDRRKGARDDRRTLLLESANRALRSWYKMAGVLP